ncbi:LysR substrate-binding domain-containing protein [Paraburkholderia terrae]
MTVEVQPHISTNHTAGALAAAASGLGIAPTTSWACRQELQSGELVQMLSDWKSTELPVNAYCPMGRRRDRRHVLSSTSLLLNF